MRLLNTETCQFQNFFDGNAPFYAILSHRWDDVEATYQEFESATTKAGPGFKKVLDCCAYARAQGLKWVWIDTCCIDKTSSAELSEAINSMFRWYNNAVECYVHLKDVGESTWKEELGTSEWWERGWTLQELLAPGKVVFLDKAWKVIGGREELAGEIARITGIPERFLDGREELGGASVAMRFSWAARRQTSRVEDRAYSLMGLFGVNMPMLYGEGRNAFLRLQLEILKLSDDESIFAWRRDTDPGASGHGMLARRLEYFRESGDIVRRPKRTDRPPYSMTHKGLKLQLPRSTVEGTTRIVLPLDCVDGDNVGPLAIVLYKPHAGFWARLDSHELRQAPSEHLWTRRDCVYPNRATIYVREEH
ncbi:hypothetical protein PV08_07093 [Exophiala spinifera]|uniref:Heterokaryon incompatibility domain-containing protein n=1 Tax=Exophiala spinifera TaxID=91928 RepID=A0A0D1YH80_9EURO|nr:uncharacterized protein PV08_07093 [Exophiala spinifera]KIW14311.1 hypothetical protein PV08_07093 [Exophiala spinifera]